MATTETILTPPPLRDKVANALGKLSDSIASWLFLLQRHSKLRLVDTTGGNYAETTPPAGLGASTGQSNQNQEIIYKKISADGNTFTLNPSANGPMPEGAQTLTTQWSKLRIKSDGTNWYVVG